MSLFVSLSSLKPFCECIIQFSSVSQSYPTLCSPMDSSTPGFLVNHQLSGLAQTHVHPVFPEAYEVKRKCQQKGELLHFCPFKTHLSLSCITIPLRSTQPVGGCGLSDPNHTAKAGKVSSDSTPGY